MSRATVNIAHLERTLRDKDDTIRMLKDDIAGKDARIQMLLEHATKLTERARAAEDAEGIAHVTMLNITRHAGGLAAALQKLILHDKKQ